MENLTKKQIEKTIETIRDFKELIKNKGSKTETVNFLMQETNLSKEECEAAVDFYDGVKLPENFDFQTMFQQTASEAQK